MTQQHWNEFLDKLDFAQLTSRWSLLPLHWLDDSVPDSLSAEEQALYEELRTLPKDLEEGEKAERIHRSVQRFRQARSARTVALDPSLTPPGSRVVLRFLDPDELGQGDCLVTVGSWDRLGHLVAQRAGWADESNESSENPIRKEPGELTYRHVVIFPDKGAAAPRAFRSLCEKTLRQVRGLGARRISITHLHLPQPGLPDRFAAAELVSAIRGMLRESGGGISVEIMPLTASNFEDYRHWFESLAALSRGESSPESTSPEREAPSDYQESADQIGNTLRDLAQKTSALAQEAGRGVTGWLRSASVPSPAERPEPSLTPPPVAIPSSHELTFDDQQVLNLLYLGQVEKAHGFAERFQENSLMGLYLTALAKTSEFLGKLTPAEESPSEPVKKKGRGKKKNPEAEDVAEAPAAEPAPASLEEQAEYVKLRAELLSTAETLGSSNALTRYFQLLAWRLDVSRPDLDMDQFEEDHARLLRAAWAWEDYPLQAFLRLAGQEAETGGTKAIRPSYVPVFPQGSRTSPRVD